VRPRLLDTAGSGRHGTARREEPGVAGEHPVLGGVDAQLVDVAEPVGGVAQAPGDLRVVEDDTALVGAARNVDPAAVGLDVHEREQGD